MATKIKPQWQSIDPSIQGTFHVKPRYEKAFEMTGRFGFIKLHNGGRPRTPSILNERGQAVKLDPRAVIRINDVVIYDGKRVGVSHEGVPYHLNRQGVRKARRKRRKR